ncbi:hypothetical protein [Azospirillum sp.]|uniref:hypothetical protein n=1 Tax=Azospirillum sp. TaxID=34012 RepID=UPI002D57CA03|nr:hypothetical protein [Azospirillum sp.]HYD70418.1 hypothetical protein [Azospirillum sp.]
MTTFPSVGDDIGIAEEALAEFSSLPSHLHASAVQLLRSLLKTSDMRFMTQREVAAIIAGPFFRSVLEQEARLSRLGFL